MSQENLEAVRDGYSQFQATGRFDDDVAASDFVWDMSKFIGWPEQQVYEGAEGARRFLADWAASWDDWELEVDALHDAGAQIVAVMRQRGRSKTTGMPVEMSFAQVWTFRDGRRARMDMYSNASEALKAVGLSE
jgi:ketosteroid isomerase-like protein